MRMRCWWMGRKEDNAIDIEGPPWIKLGRKEEGRSVLLELGGALPDNNQMVVKFTEQEWPIIKDRIDAAFSGGDPNQECFYQGPGSLRSQQEAASGSSKNVPPPG